MNLRLSRAGFRHSVALNWPISNPTFSHVLAHHRLSIGNSVCRILSQPSCIILRNLARNGDKRIAIHSIRIPSPVIFSYVSYTTTRVAVQLTCLSIGRQTPNRLLQTFHSLCNDYQSFYSFASSDMIENDIAVGSSERWCRTFHDIANS